jgi:hypothetical protein
MTLEKLVIPDDSVYFEMEGLSEYKQSRVVKDLIQEIEQKAGSLEGFLDYLLFRVRRGYRERMENYLNTIFERRNRFVVVFFFFTFLLRGLYSSNEVFISSLQQSQ